MIYPYIALNVPENASNEQIRLAYLNGIRKHPPETHPAEFQQIRDAYEAVKDDIARARLRLFGMPGNARNRNLAELAPPAASPRRKLGVEIWMTINR